MAEFNLLLKLRDVLGAVINPRREDGHGSAVGTPTHVSVASLPSGLATAAKQDTQQTALDGIGTDTQALVITSASTAQSTAGIGAITDAESVSGNGSSIAILKRLRTIFTSVWNTAANALSAVLVPQAVIKRTLVVNALGAANVLYTPTAGMRLRLASFGYSAGLGVSGITVGLKIEGYNAGAVFDRQYLVAPGQPFNRNIMAGQRYLEGSVDGRLLLETDAAQPVNVNVELTEHPP